ncbi:37S ribosomal protein S22 [Bachmanniomyces sp. S44760]|nr:37S ribosomal protein S22 [Bachmanniomyces sp. S44760]
MILHPIGNRLCGSCRLQLLVLFRDGFRRSGKPLHAPNARTFRAATLDRRSFSSARQLRQNAGREPEDVRSDADQSAHPKTPAQMEMIARKARQMFGETLPADFLSEAEYNIYERLYGRPLRETRLEDISSPWIAASSTEQELETPSTTLLRENQDGDLEEVELGARAVSEDSGKSVTLEEVESIQEGQDDFEARMVLFEDSMNSNEPLRVSEEPDLSADVPGETADSKALDERALIPEYFEAPDETYDFDLEDESDAAIRAHPLTMAGRFFTSPSTLQLPRDTFIDPISEILVDASSKHLKEVAERTFGGPGLPNSTATPVSKRNLKQAPIALEASQSKMGVMEANAYIAAVMPGTYAAVMSTVVETRRRLGSDWLGALMSRDQGPHILDAGGGGAGMLAVQEALRAEWERVHPDEPFSFNGTATVVTGSSELRHRASRLLQNTSFLPRLQDYIPSKDTPIAPENLKVLKGQYDIIVAPHTLWTLREDHMRKAQVRNLWSLLNPDGGVLILVEKGIPRGFELIAAAREDLLDNRIASPGSHSRLAGSTSGDGNEARKEEGMIVAPCTNHVECPMYTEAGRGTRRKDFCHFSQRFIRPPFYQHLMGARDRNHEEVQFSYVVVRRGKDKRLTDNIIQDASATEAAFAGHDDAMPPTMSDPGGQGYHADSSTGPSSVIDPLSLPRSLLPPIKRQGHVTLDLCTPSGTLERWTVPRSFSKEAYRDARKSRWGDLWALGAKTRVVKTARVGSVILPGKKAKYERKGRRSSRDEDDEDDFEDIDEAGMTTKMKQVMKRRGSIKVDRPRKKLNAKRFKHKKMQESLD